MDEIQLIEALQPLLFTNASTLVGAGDDCAVLDVGMEGEALLLKTDAVVEGVHFDADTPPERIGHKALGRCLSDLAAMGGVPGSAVVTIGLPEGFDPGGVKTLYRGLNALAREFDVAVVGGETVSCPGGLFVSVALVGRVKRGRAVLRRGAKVGDAIFVTGELGGSRSGKHLAFQPRVREALWLTERFSIHSMIDISDGLARDLRHLLEASQVGAEIHEAFLPVSREAQRQSRIEGDGRSGAARALTDGEDFELVFTLEHGSAVRLKDAWKDAFPRGALSCIGRIERNPGLRLRDRRGVRKLDLHGFRHFQ